MSTNNKKFIRKVARQFVKKYGYDSLISKIKIVPDRWFQLIIEKPINKLSVSTILLLFTYFNNKKHKLKVEGNILNIESCLDIGAINGFGIINVTSDENQLEKEILDRVNKTKNKIILNFKIN